MEYKNENNNYSASEHIFSDGNLQAIDESSNTLDDVYVAPRNQGLVSDYIEAMQLEADPFSAEAQPPDTSYLGAGRQEILDQIDHLSEFSASVLVISGMIGSGKTTLFTHLCEHLAAHWKLCPVSAQELSSTELIFNHLAAALQADTVSGASVGELMVAIRYRLLQGELEPFMLLVDDAHLLDDTVLGALMSLLQSNGVDGELPFHVILLGDEALIHRLDGFSLVDVLLHDLNLQPFTVAETQEYLLHRLKSVGWTDELPFDEVELSQLQIESEGNPSRLNDAARRLLMDRVTIDYEQLEGKAGLPIAHLFSVVLLLGVLIMAYFYKDSWFMAGEQTIEVASLPMPQKQLASQAGGVDVSAQNEASVVLDKIAREQVQSPILSSTMSTEFKPNALIELKSSGVQEAIASDSKEMSQVSAVLPPIELELAGTSVANTPPIPAQLAVPAAKYSEPSALPKPESTVVRRAFSDTLTADEQVLMALEANRYVLQVMAAGSRSAVEQFIASQPNRSQLRLFTSWRLGKPWYVVVVGDFNSLVEARQEAVKLPLMQKKAGPWPRSAASIQSTIKDFRRI